MPTQYLKFTGKSRWNKHIYTTDDAFGAQKFKCGLWIDKETLEEYNKSGIQKKVKSDEKGDYVEFTRDAVKMIKGAPVFFVPPTVYNKDGSVAINYTEGDEVVRSYNDPNRKAKIVRNGDPIIIGNDSDLEVTVAVFDTMKGKGQRLESIRIIDLITYDPDKKSFNDAPPAPEMEAEVKPKVKGKAPW